MQKYFRSVAMIRRYEREQAAWLGVWNRNRSQWDFIIGERLDQESFRETALREVSWQLGLDRNRDLLVSNMSHLNLEYVGCVPGETEQKHVALAFYAVDVYRAAAMEKICKSADCAWLSSQEVCTGQRSDGTSVDPKVTTWVNRWGIIQPWQ